MKITQKEIRHVAQLARLDLPQAAIESFYGQLGDILNYMETLNQVDTREVMPTAHAIDLTNALRTTTPNRIWTHPRRWKMPRCKTTAALLFPR